MKIDVGAIVRHLKAYLQLLSAIAYAYWAHRRWGQYPDLAFIDAAVALVSALLFLRFVRYQLVYMLLATLRSRREKREQADWPGIRDDDRNTFAAERYEAYVAPVVFTVDDAT